MTVSAHKESQLPASWDIALFVSSIMIYLYRINHEKTKTLNFLFIKPLGKEQELQIKFHGNMTPNQLLKKLFSLYPNLISFNKKNIQLKVNLRDELPALNRINKEMNGFFVFETQNITAIINCHLVPSNLSENLIFKHILRIKKFIATNLDVNIKKISLISLQEKEKIFNNWNKTDHNISDKLSIHRQFEENASKKPKKIVLMDNGKKITYQKLNTESNRFANFLITCNIKMGDRVAIYLDRSFELFSIILGILKLGATYVPIDTKYPIQRVKYILNNSQCKLIIADNNSLHSNQNLQGTSSAQVVCLNMMRDYILTCSATYKSKRISLNNTAYIIYTSGSTGSPKGVQISHKNVINYTHWFADIFKFTNNSIIDFSSSIGFDLSVACTLTPMIIGGSVAICDERSKLDPVQYIEHLACYAVTHIEITPNYFSHLLFYSENLILPKKLKWVMLGGDALIKKDIMKWRAIRPKDKIVNEYGPTECTVAMTAHIINKKTIVSNKNSIPIGKPMFNTKIYILDKFNNLLPPEIPGELCIAGACVSKGYIDFNQTKKKFISNPFGTKNFSIIYKTGDLAYWLPDGNVEFLGRIDEQIKVRGYRIEPYEVEECISKHDQVNTCKVLVKKLQNEAALSAYIIPNTKSLDLLNLKNYLKEHLPEYMIPSEFIIIDEYPVNASGKVDTKKLRGINNTLEKIKEAHDDNSKNNLTDAILKIWQLAFGSDTIKQEDDFFEIGGNSLLLMKIIREIYEKLSIKLQVKIFFENPSIKLLVKAIEYNNEISSSYTSNKYPTIICLNNKSNLPAIFLFPPLGKTAFVYKGLSKYLCLKNNIYILQDPGVERPDTKFDSIKDMATHYIYEIQKIQKDQPYLLIGASFGATLAVEVAHQLETLGKEVSFVGLIDGWATYSKKLANRKFFYEMMRKKLEGLQDIDELLEMQFLREQLIIEYMVPKLNAKLTLFKAENKLPLFAEIDLENNGWNANFSNVIDLYIMPGDHYTILEEPNVKVLGSKMKKLIEVSLMEVMNNAC